MAALLAPRPRRGRAGRAECQSLRDLLRVKGPRLLHSLPFFKFATNEAIQRTEAYEYAQSLGTQACSLPSFQVGGDRGAPAPRWARALCGPAAEPEAVVSPRKRGGDFGNLEAFAFDTRELKPVELSLNFGSQHLEH